MIGVAKYTSTYTYIYTLWRCYITHWSLCKRMILISGCRTDRFPPAKQLQWYPDDIMLFPQTEAVRTNELCTKILQIDFTNSL